MQFLKQIKSKALALPIFDKKVSKQAEGPGSGPEPSKENGKQTNIKSVAKSFFSKFKEENTITETNGVAQKISTKPLVYQQGRIWMTVPAPNPPPVNPQILKQKQINNQLEAIDPDSAEQFIKNMYKSMEDTQRARKMRINKAKNSIFGSLQIEPIYLSENSMTKIFKMELQVHHDHLIQRTQTLVLERITVDKSIENVLHSGYLWQVHDEQNSNLMETCFEIFEQNQRKLERKLQEISEIRSKFQLIASYLNKLNLNRKRVVLGKKIQLLNKIKSYKKEACVEFQNLDQAFYIERGRQKLYQQLKVNEKLLQKVILLQSFVSKIQKQNKKVVSIVEEQLIRWIDENQRLEPKSIQKLLILLYFIRNQKMYSDQNLNVNLSKLKNRNAFMKQLNEVKLWKDYKYVNDRAIKAKVTEFLDILIAWLSKQDQKDDRDAKMNKKMQVVPAKIEQKQDKMIKF